MPRHRLRPDVAGDYWAGERDDRPCRDPASKRRCFDANADPTGDDAARVRTRALETIEMTWAARDPKLVQDQCGRSRLCASSVSADSRFSGETPVVARRVSFECFYPKVSEAVLLLTNDSEASSGGRRAQVLMIVQTLRSVCCVVDESTAGYLGLLMK